MRTLLLLVDDRVIIKSLRSTLSQYRLIHATTAEQALRLFVDHGRYVDLFLTDIAVGSAGLRLAMFLRSEMRSLPVVVIAGDPTKNWTARDSVDLHRLGKSSVTILNRPVQPRVLVRSVEELLEHLPPNPPRAPH
jgi:DNA-binding NtrC family response regulator